MIPSDPLTPTPEQAALRATMRSFGAEVLAPGATLRDAGAADMSVFKDLWLACGKEGVLGLCLPQEFGGDGHSVATTVHALEALGEGAGDNGMTLAVCSFLWAVAQPLLVFGSPEQKQRLLPALVRGERIACFALSEADKGSDALAAQTTATATDDGYVLNGQKAWVGMGPVADLAIVFANAAPERGAWGLSTFLVERDDPGANFGPPDEKLGVRSSPLGTLTLSDCHIPTERRLGAEGCGQSLFTMTMEWERAFIFAAHVGAMARQLADCVDFARARVTFGKPIIEHQSVANRLAEMRLRLEASRLMLHRAAALKDAGRSIPQEAALTKLQISEAFAASSMDALRIFGARGYLSGTAQERDLRDAASGVIYGGTSDIQRQVIARLL